MTEPRARCTSPGCGRFVRRGEHRCHLHRRDALEDEEIVELEKPAAAEFRRRLESGDYRQLLDEKLRSVIAQAANGRDLTDEIGALRVVLARLLLEEEDLSRLVSGVSRLASVTVQASRAQRAITGEMADGLTEAIAHILAELDGGYR